MKTSKHLVRLAIQMIALRASVTYMRVEIDSSGYLLEGASPTLLIQLDKDDDLPYLEPLAEGTPPNFNHLNVVVPAIIELWPAVTWMEIAIEANEARVHTDIISFQVSGDAITFNGQPIQAATLRAMIADYDKPERTERTVKVDEGRIGRFFNSLYRSTL